MKKLGLGVLGLGEGRSIISGCLGSDLWQLVRLCDLNEELCRQRAAEFRFPHTTTNYADLLNDPAIDAIGIYTPDQLHAKHICMALETGKHVICTKPFLNDLSEAAEVLRLQRATGKRIFVGQSSRFFAPFARQHAHFSTGELGELVTIEAQYHADHRWFLKKPWAKNPDFTWLFGCISHPADMVRWYLGEIEEVMGYGCLSPNGKAGGLANEDTFHFILKSTQGVIARVSGAYSGPTVPAVRDSGMSTILRGTLGASQADYHELRYTYRIGERQVQETYEHLMNYYFRFEGITHHAGEYQNYLEYFARCLESGETAHPDVEEGIVTIALLQAMQASLRRGQPVKVREILEQYGLAELAG